LIIPQLTYALTILPSPGELFLNDIEKILLKRISGMINQQRLKKLFY
jgi:hypothetical protein